MKVESAPKSPLTPYPPKGGLPNSMIFRCSPLGLGVKHLKIIEFTTFRSGLKVLIFLSFILSGFLVHAQNSEPENVNPNIYLSGIKTELQKEWPQNRTVNIVFHGHSVPAGYFKTPHVNTMGAYPNLFLKKLKEIYPYAVVNVIVTAIGGENSVKGAGRFESDVLFHKPDVILIDYALNDRGVGLEKAKEAWNKMINLAKKQNIKVILVTPSPDQNVNLADSTNVLKKHTDQIIQLAKENQVALIDSYKAFEFLYSDKDQLAKYMSQVNHPNELGHELIANEIIEWFK